MKLLQRKLTLNDNQKHSDKFNGLGTNQNRGINSIDQDVGLARSNSLALLQKRDSNLTKLPENETSQSTEALIALKSQRYQMIIANEQPSNDQVLNLQKLNTRKSNSLQRNFRASSLGKNQNNSNRGDAEKVPQPLPAKKISKKNSLSCIRPKEFILSSDINGNKQSRHKKLVTSNSIPALQSSSKTGTVQKRIITSDSRNKIQQQRFTEMIVGEARQENVIPLNPFHHALERKISSFAYNQSSNSQAQEGKQLSSKIMKQLSKERRKSERGSTGKNITVVQTKLFGDTDMRPAEIVPKLELQGIKASFSQPRIINISTEPPITLFDQNPKEPEAKNKGSRYQSVNKKSKKVYFKKDDNSRALAEQKKALVEKEEAVQRISVSPGFVKADDAAEDVHSTVQTAMPSLEIEAGEEKMPHILNYRNYQNDTKQTMEQNSKLHSEEDETISKKISLPDLLTKIKNRKQTQNKRSNRSVDRSQERQTFYKAATNTASTVRLAGRTQLSENPQSDQVHIPDILREQPNSPRTWVIKKVMINTQKGLHNPLDSRASLQDSNPDQQQQYQQPSCLPDQYLYQQIENGMNKRLFSQKDRQKLFQLGQAIKVMDETPSNVSERIKLNTPQDHAMRRSDYAYSNYIDKIKQRNRIKSGSRDSTSKNDKVTTTEAMIRGQALNLPSDEYQNQSNHGGIYRKTIQSQQVQPITDLEIVLQQNYTEHPDSNKNNLMHQISRESEQFARLVGESSSSSEQDYKNQITTPKKQFFETIAASEKKSGEKSATQYAEPNNQNKQQVFTRNPKTEINLNPVKQTKGFTTKDLAIANQIMQQSSLGTPTRQMSSEEQSLNHGQVIRQTQLLQDRIDQTTLLAASDNEPSKQTIDAIMTSPENNWLTRNNFSSHKKASNTKSLQKSSQKNRDINLGEDQIDSQTVSTKNAAAPKAIVELHSIGKKNMNGFTNLPLKEFDFKKVGGAQIRSNDMFQSVSSNMTSANQDHRHNIHRIPKAINSDINMNDISSKAQNSTQSKSFINKALTSRSQPRVLIAAKRRQQIFVGSSSTAKHGQLVVTSNAFDESQPQKNNRAVSSIKLSVEAVKAQRSTFVRAEQSSSLPPQIITSHAAEVEQVSNEKDQEKKLGRKQ